ncbi:MAG: carbohydrate ABC transporter permease [Candidatus Eremiobacterota bacterium]
MRRTAFTLGLGLFLLAVGFPFYWQVLTSLKTSEEIWHIPPVWLPGQGFEPNDHGLPRFVENYTDVFTEHPFLLYLKNSAIVSLLTTAFCLAIGSLSAFALAKLSFRGKHLVLALVLSVSMFPPVAIAPSLFLVLREVGLLDTYLGLILPYTTFALPLALWNLTAFFRQIPGELLESARVDGAGYFTTFHRIFLPLVAPGLFTTGILTFIAAWNEFLFALFFTTTEEMRTVPVGIALFPGQYESPWGQIAAATVIVTLPLIVLVLYAQKRIVAGLTAGAVKG